MTRDGVNENAAIATRADQSPAPGFVTLDVLRYLGLDPNRIETRALVLLCQRYGLDPLLGHVSVIRTGNGQKVYVTRDGMLDVAHRSGLLDGIVVDEERRNSTNDGYTARVSVYRKDCAHPFTYGAQCKDSEPQAGKGHGPEMALARAERRALRRAFSVPAGTVAGDDYDGPNLDAIADDVYEIPESELEDREREPVSELGRAARSTPPPAGRPRSLSEQSTAHATVARMADPDKAAFLEEFGIEDFATIWPDEAVDAALELPL